MITYCEETHRIYRDQEDLTQLGPYHFNFTSEGLFTLLNKEGDPVYNLALPLFERLISHLVWIFFWLTLILVSTFFLPDRLLRISNTLFMSLILFHLFLFGCRLMTLLIRGGLKPILFPPLWVRLTRQFQKGQGIELLKKHHLEDHPGLLMNLALAQWSHKEYDQARETLKRASSLCPNHPLLASIDFRNQVQEPKNPDEIDHGSDQKESPEENNLAYDPKAR